MTVSTTSLANLAGIVAVFDQSEGCPKGWTDFIEAAGRMIIGVGQGSIDRDGDQDVPLTLRWWREYGREETSRCGPTKCPAIATEYRAWATLMEKEQTFGSIA